MFGVTRKNTDNFLKAIDISSSSNKSVKEWRSLQSGHGIKRHGKALVSGVKVVSELLRLKPEIIKGWITPSDGKPPPLNVTCVIPWYRLKDGLFRELDINGTGYPLLLVKVPEFESFQESEISDSVILLVPFQDPTNVGAVIRSAAAFGVNAIVLLEEAATPFHPKSIRAAGTQAFTVRLMNGPSINELVGLERPLVALSTRGINIETFSFPDRFALLPGLEGPGLPGGLKPDFTISIPMESTVESLNAAAATAVVLYVWRKLKKQ